MSNEKLSMMDDLMLEVMALRKENAVLKTTVLAQQTTNSDYAALEQAWRKLADESTDASYSAHLYDCADDLFQLNAAKAPHCA